MAIKRFTHTRRKHHDDDPVAIWNKNEIDIKVKCVCERCNSGWMSQLESEYAKPVIGGMILHLNDVPMTSRHRFAISAFAFKTAAVVAAMANASEFFLTQERREFAKALRLPEEIHIFIASYFGSRNAGGDLSVSRYESTLPGGDAFELYVVTWRAGHFVFQVATPRIIVAPGWKSQNYKFESKFPMGAFVSQIWPYASEAPWPPVESLGDYSFKQFCNRWKELRFFAA